jgi:hypothetical protein
VRRNHHTYWSYAATYRKCIQMIYCIHFYWRVLKILQLIRFPMPVISEHCCHLKWYLRDSDFSADAGCSGRVLLVLRESYRTCKLLRQNGMRVWDFCGNYMTQPNAFLEKALGQGIIKPSYICPILEDNYFRIYYCCAHKNQLLCFYKTFGRFRAWQRDKITSSSVEIYEKVLRSDVSGSVSRFIPYYISKRNFFRISTFVEGNWLTPLRNYLQ